MISYIATLSFITKITYITVYTRILYQQCNTYHTILLIKRKIKEIIDNMIYCYY